MLNPTLYLAFPDQEDAEQAATQHLCLCRNEDVVLPDPDVRATSEAEFEQITGFELRFGQEVDGAFMVGYNRFDGGRPMYGALTITGDPTVAQPTGA